MLNKADYNIPYYAPVTIGQTIYSISATGIKEWEVYSITFKPVVRVIELIHYTNNLFSEMVSIFDIRIGLDFFLTKIEAETNLEKIK